VGRRVDVLFDSGIRTGADITKALCLGAKAVLVGRPVVYGLGARGEEGAAHVLRCLLAVRFSSCRSVAAANPGRRRTSRSTWL